MVDIQLDIVGQRIPTFPSIVIGKDREGMARDQHDGEITFAQPFSQRQERVTATDAAFTGNGMVPDMPAAPAAVKRNTMESPFMSAALASN